MGDESDTGTLTGTLPNTPLPPTERSPTSLDAEVLLGPAHPSPSGQTPEVYFCPFSTPGSGPLPFRLGTTRPWTRTLSPDPTSFRTDTGSTLPGPSVRSDRPGWDVDRVATLPPGPSRLVTAVPCRHPSS